MLHLVLGFRFSLPFLRWGFFLFMRIYCVPSISQAQAKFLESGGPKEGVSRSSFTIPVKGSNVNVVFDGDASLGTMEAMLSLYIGEFLTMAANELAKQNKTNTGALVDSLNFKIEKLPRGYRVNFLAADYYRFVDEGVQGVGPGNRNSTSPFKFKFATPSKSHVQAIQRWITEGKSKAIVSDISRYGGTRQEGKGSNGVAWIIARSVKRKGLVRTGFWSGTFDKVFADFNDKMSKALGQDIKVDLRLMKAALLKGGSTSI